MQLVAVKVQVSDTTMLNYCNWLIQQKIKCLQ